MNFEIVRIINDSDGTTVRIDVKLDAEALKNLIQKQLFGEAPAAEPVAKQPKKYKKRKKGVTEEERKEQKHEYYLKSKEKRDDHPAYESEEDKEKAYVAGKRMQKLDKKLRKTEAEFNGKASTPPERE